MLILLGWQFMVAEFVGGPIMITIVAVSGGYVFSRALTTRARGRLQLADVGHAHHVVVHASDTHEPLHHDFELPNPCGVVRRVELRRIGRRR